MQTNTGGKLFKSYLENFLISIVAKCGSKMRQSVTLVVRAAE